MMWQDFAIHEANLCYAGEYKVVCVNTIVNAQSLADDPEIGEPGSQGNRTSGDDGPIVPFDGGMTLMLAASGIG